MSRSKSNQFLKVNDTFSSYRELQEAVTRYENANRVQFWKRDAKKLQRVTPRIYEIVKSYPQLEYYSIKFTCIHGGQTFRPKNLIGGPQRKSKGTWKQNCKAEILVGLNEDKDRLVVKKIVEEHNHEIPSEEVYKLFPRHRRHDQRQQNSNRPFLLNGKQEKQKILDNVVKANSLARSNNLKRIAKTLGEKYNCTVDLQSDSQNKVVGFLFQDVQMKKYFHFFPEILLIDGTYKLQNIGCSVYIMSSENSLGTSDVIAVAALTLEDRDSLDWMLGTFKKRNPRWDQTTIIMTDRLTSDYKLIPNHFPNAKRLICLSHACQLFKKDTTASKISTITPTESDKCFDFFLKLSEAKCEEEYHSILEDMEDNILYPLVQYFVQSWHHLRTEWVTGLTPVGRYVNSKLEHPNSKLKSSIANCKTFSRFIENLFLVLYLKRNETKCNFGRIFTKVSTFDDDPVIQQYKKSLTPYATEKIRPNLYFSDSQDEITFDCPNEDSDVICEVSGNTFVVSEISCNCDFFTSMKLPCRHLLMYRRVQDLDLFDERIFAKRWTKNYLRDLFADCEVGTTAQNDSQVLPTEKTTEEKFEEAQGVCLALVGLCSEATGKCFEGRLAVLNKLRELWQSGVEVKVERVGSSGEVVWRDHDYVGCSGMDMEVEEGETQKI